MAVQNTIELDLECYKALESHRLSLDETPLDILRRVLLSPDRDNHARQAGPGRAAAGGAAPGRAAPGRAAPGGAAPGHTAAGIAAAGIATPGESGTSPGVPGRAHLASGLVPASVPPDWQDPNDETERQTGNYLVQMGERACFAASQKAAYRLALIWLEKTSPGLLDRLADAGTRNRRIVAPSPGALYPRSPALAKHAEKLVDGWYVDVNLSKEQKLSRLRTACRLAGVMFGKDLIVDL